MNRRKFFRWLGVGSVAAVVAPSTLLFSEPSSFDKLKAEHKVCDLADYGNRYANYTNFSAYALASAIDDSVSYAASELGSRSGLMLNEMVKHVDNRI